MKRRDGFVSNSSSSSFVVAVPKGKRKITVSFEMDLADYGTVIRSKEEWLDVVKEDYISEEVRGEGLKKLSEGKEIIRGYFRDYGESPTEGFLCAKGLNGLDIGDVEVLDGDGGY